MTAASASRTGRRGEDEDRAPILLSLVDLPGDESTRIFTGGGHGGGVEISFFEVAKPRGEGPDLHRHPHEEVFIVHSGTGFFVVGDQRIAAEPESVVVVPPRVAHGFKSTSDALRMTCIQPSTGLESEWIEGGEIDAG